MQMNLGATREKNTYRLGRRVRAVANAKEPRSHKKGKYIERKYHLIREIVSRGDAVVSQIASEDNLADPFTKGLAQKIFDQHVEGMGVRCIASWL